MKSGSLGRVMISMLALKARDMCLILTPGAIFPIVMTLIGVIMIAVKLSDVWLMNLPCVYICTIIALCNCKH